jgi:hypothetical protein
VQQPPPSHHTSAVYHPVRYYDYYYYCTATVAMPPILTQIARASDALPLVATSTPTPNLVLTPQMQSDAKKLMRSMTAG